LDNFQWFDIHHAYLKQTAVATIAIINTPPRTPMTIHFHVLDEGGFVGFGVGGVCVGGVCVVAAISLFILPTFISKRLF